MLSGVESGLEEGGAQGFDPAFAHSGLAFPLATRLEPWIIAHEGLEPGGDFAIVPGVEDFPGKVSEDFGGGSGTEPRYGFHERFGLWIDALSGEGFDLSIESAQTRFHGAEGLEDTLQGRSAGRAQLGIGDRVSR